jgi:hypothetical protein
MISGPASPMMPSWNHVVGFLPDETVSRPMRLRGRCWMKSLPSALADRGACGLKSALPSTRARPAASKSRRRASVDGLLRNR